MDGFDFLPNEPIKALERDIFCEGDPRSAMGHPRVYLTIGPAGWVDCPYCARHFILQMVEDSPGMWVGGAL